MSATHDLRSGKRGFNAEYAGLMRHLGMKPRTIEIGKKQQNGDVEALHRSLKRRLEQHLLLRGSRDFESRGAIISVCDDYPGRRLPGVPGPHERVRLRRRPGGF